MAPISGIATELMATTLLHAALKTARYTCIIILVYFSWMLWKANHLTIVVTSSCSVNFTCLVYRALKVAILMVSNIVHLPALSCIFFQHGNYIKIYNWNSNYTCETSWKNQYIWRSYQNVCNISLGFFIIFII